MPIGMASQARCRWIVLALRTVNFVALELAGEHATADRLASATDFARAQTELLRIRAVRTDQFAKVDINDFSNLKAGHISPRWTDMNVTRLPNKGGQRKKLQS